jgi:hypothetical protein
MNDVEQAAVHHIGMYRSRTSRLPIQYYNRLPHTHASDVAFILDPCVGTSDTLQAVCGIIEKWYEHPNLNPPLNSKSSFLMYLLIIYHKHLLLKTHNDCLYTALHVT